jgi:hypothetical protein
MDTLRMMNRMHKLNLSTWKREQVLLRSRRKPAGELSRDAKKMDRVKHMYSVGLLNPKLQWYIGEDKSYIEATTHHRQAEIATEERSPFRPCRGLATLNLLLDAMPCLKIWSATLTYYTCDICGPEQHKQIGRPVILPK